MSVLRRMMSVSGMALLLWGLPPAPQADEMAHSPLSPAELKALKHDLFGGLDISFSGFARIEGTAEHHFDLGAAPGAANTFYDFRGWLASRIAKGPAALHIAVNYAGNDFSDPEGGILGNAFDNTRTPGGPSVVRQKGFDLRIRHLYLTYDGFVQASAGRMPANIGHGIAINTIRDSAKLGKSFGPLKVVAVLVKGGETQPNNNLNAATDNDLDAYGAVFNYNFEGPVFDASSAMLFGAGAQLPGKDVFHMRNHVQFVVMKQVDTTFDDRLPEKLLFDFNGDFHSGVWFYAFETAVLTGHTPRDPAFSRRKNRAWMGYVRGQYRFDYPHAWLALALGLGSGENQKSEKQHDFQSFFMDAIGFHLANIYGNDIYGYDAFLPGVNGDGNNAGSGFANTGFVQLSGKIAPFSFIPDTTIEGVFTYMRATRRQMVGEGVLFGGLDGFTAAPGVTETSHDIGWEADINLEHPLTGSMHSYLRTGWFVPGSIFGPSRRTAFKLQGGVDFSF
ncbi:MAG: hypothetical protein Q9M27_00425 [Mariprofundaceae bacterium]|nr:hypothetical protein [Mariprofundaceae bacterium]